MLMKLNQVIATEIVSKVKIFPEAVQALEDVTFFLERKVIQT